MQINLYYEYAAIIISIVLLIYFGTTKKASSFQNKIFLVLIIDNILTAVLDIINKILDYYGGGVEYLKLTTMGYFITHLLILPLIFFYVLASVRNWYEIPFVLKALSVLPITIAYAVLLSNPFTNFIYRYDEDGNYYRESGYIMLYALVVFYIILMIWLMVQYRKLFSLVKKFTLIAEIIILAIAMVMQATHHYQRIETFGITYCLLLMFFMVQNPRDQVDKETGLYNHKAFYDMMGIYFATKKYFNLVEVIISDFDQVTANNSNEEKGNAACQIGEYLKELNEDIKVYRIESNLFCLEISDMAEEDIIKLIRTISKRFRDSWSVGDYNVMYKIKMCHISVPEEIDNLAQLTGIVNGSIVKEINKELLSVSDFDLGKLERLSGLNAAIAKGLEEDNVEIVFSPVCSVQNRKIVSTDTAIRLFDSDIGYISKEEILEFAEKHGKVGQLSRLQFDKVCNFINTNNPKELGLARIGIELTAAMCHQVGFIDYIVKEIDKYKIDPSQIIFKVSEYTVHMAPSTIASIMDELHSKGFNFALYDYGSGFTNLASIYEFSFDCIEVSSAVVKEAMVNDKAKITLESTFELAKDLGMRTVVRGIDNEKAFEVISTAGCERAIGEYFLENISEKELVNILVSQENVMAAKGIGSTINPFKEGGIA